MIVTIVAKTRMGRGACIGGITADGRSVRLVAPDMAFNEQFNLDYRVGEMWEIEGEPPAELLPPHTENVIVRRKRRVDQADDLLGLIERHMNPRAGGPEALYDGLAQAHPGGPLFIAQRTGVPEFSTMFWRPDRPLALDTAGKRIRYRYPNEDDGHTLTFVGFQEPIEVLPAGTLLRVSLAHWWRPKEYPEFEQRCYLQLSGWFLPQESEWFRGPADEEAFGTDWIDGVIEAEQQESASSQDEVRRALKRVFGYDEFRPLQAEIIDNVLAGRDSLAVMPTGSGKSMCFQLPALLFPGLTVVVSPLISLMEDQVMQLQQLGVPAAYLNSTLAYEGYVTITQQVRAGRIKLLYTSPETLLRPETLVMLDQCRVDCLTIDEAHCISEWGHDFRPEYRQLVEVRRRLPHAVCLAVTATATERVRRDIKETLVVGDADEFISSFDRENLFLAVTPRDDGLGQILEFLEGHRQESGIIYCATRERTDTLASRLRAQGWNALAYHAGLDYAARRENQRRFSHDEAVIIVATIAFGMGINKSNVRFVIHHDLPKDLENYYQQIGRAGRDGLPADCLLLFSRQDVVTINFLADRDAPNQRAAAAARLQAMIAFAETRSCRRRPLLGYFGESDTPETCGNCDNCLAGDPELIDLTIPAQKFLSCVVRTGQIFGASYVIDVLRGSRRKEILSRRHEELPTYNLGQEFTRSEWQQLARQFVSDRLLLQDMDHGSLKMTPDGRAVLKGETYRGTAPTADRPSRRTAMPQDYDAELFERLRRYRMELAREASVPPYVIFSDAALREMAIYYPHSRDSFVQMQGVGAVKLERYGEAFLRIIRDYCREKGLAQKSKR
ncbi:MAG: DNA helicase RecQ [Candidatus Promineofilum sp.]|nr:DNA helicase RecQ [Promineifilum sp.]